MLNTALSTFQFLTSVCKKPFCFRNSNCSCVIRVRVSSPIVVSSTFISQLCFLHYVVEIEVDISITLMPWHCFCIFPYYLYLHMKCEIFWGQVHVSYIFSLHLWCILVSSQGSTTTSGKFSSSGSLLQGELPMGTSESSWTKSTLPLVAVPPT